jgi:hypothetical protein
MKHGKGCYTSENGRRYDGMFKNDRPVDEWPKFQNGIVQFYPFFRLTNPLLDIPFNFNAAILSALMAKGSSSAESEEAVRSLSAVVLRHIHTLRQAYIQYCDDYTRVNCIASNGTQQPLLHDRHQSVNAERCDHSVSMVQMWKFFRDCGLLKTSSEPLPTTFTVSALKRDSGVRLVDMDRAIARGFKDDNWLRQHYDVRILIFVQYFCLFIAPKR